MFISIRKKVLAGCAAVLLSLCIAAQSHFAKFISTNNTSNYSTASVISSDGKLVMVGYNDNGTSQVIKLNNSGMLDWAYNCQSTNISQYTSLNSVVELENRLYVGGGIGADAYLLSMNQSGAKLWSKKLNLIGSIIGITTDSVNLYLLSQEQINYYSIITKIDSSGNILWSKMYNSTDYVNDILYNPLSQKVIFNTHSTIIAIDTSGNVSWSNLYPSSYLNKITLASNNKYLIAGNEVNGFTFISLLDNSGNPIWSKLILPDTGYNYAPVPVALLNSIDGSTYFGTTDNSFAVSRPTSLVKLDASGNLIWCKSYFGFGATESSIIGVWDNPINGDLWLGGYRKSVYEDMFFVSSDTSGQAGCDAVSISPRDSSFTLQNSVVFLTSQVANLLVSNAQDSLSQMSTNQYFDCINSVADISNISTEVNVFPNPASEIVAFQFSGLNGDAIIKLFDVLGREIWSEKINNSKAVFSATGQSVGMYFYRLEQLGEIKATGKLIIEK